MQNILSHLRSVAEIVGGKVSVMFSLRYQPAFVLLQIIELNIFNGFIFSEP